ncbi:MAG: multicopper oxidase family protein [Sporichthyaceae bacterium]
MNRREFLGVGIGLSGAAALSACSSGRTALVSPAGRDVRAAESRRPTAGIVREVTLTPQAGIADLGGPTVATWTYGGVLPGETIRIDRGEILQARVLNRLPAATSVHWHGIGLRNDMDGVPGVTQAETEPGAEFTYRFVADTAGTHWFHPHTGLQLDRGLYAPLIVEDPDEPARYESEWVVVLDDWLDGVDGGSPDAVFAQLQSTPMMDHGSMGGGPGTERPASGPAPSTGQALMGATSALLGGDAGDVDYPYYLINGRVATAPTTFTAKPGARIRIRLINAGGDTAFRVALGDHRLRVTHTDGNPVVPIEVDTLLVGMGERYDLEVTAADGVFPLVALAEGKGQSALALLRTGSGSAPPAAVRPAELLGALLRYDQLAPTPEVALPARKIEREHRLELTGGMGAYSWGLNGKPFQDSEPLTVEAGRRARLSFSNKTMMWHPMHLHGHSFQINGNGPRKDTVAVLPGQTVTADFDADNPGRWMIHCHNAYHLEAGMMGTLAYTI